jgi:glycosyltransferase involved in cell wall biosynthesis
MSETALPRISIAMPCFNAAATLPLALASALAQTYPEWECICVDDGSRDETWDVLLQARRGDARFRIERFPANRGRGAARQRCLELARGELLAFLDADDWIYPDKLARQVEQLRADARIAVLSAQTAITDAAGRLLGVSRGAREGDPALEVGAFPRPRPPGLVFAASLLPMDLARWTGFDPHLPRSQDSDFLVRALLGRHYAVSSEILYVYSQGTAASLSSVLQGYRCRMRAHLKHARGYPLDVARTLALTAGKYALFRAAGALGAQQRLVERRWRRATSGEATGFAAAHRQVAQLCRKYFGSGAP